MNINILGLILGIIIGYLISSIRNRDYKYLLSQINQLESENKVILDKNNLKTADLAVAEEKVRSIASQRDDFEKIKLEITNSAKGGLAWKLTKLLWKTY